MSDLAPQTKTFPLKPGIRSNTELQGLLDTLRPDGILDVRSGVVNNQLILNVIYRHTHPKVTYHSPTHGEVGVTTASDQVLVSFDEALDATQVNLAAASSYVTIYEDGTDVTSNLTVFTVLEGTALIMQGAFGNASKQYQILLKQALPFSTGRALNDVFLFSFRTA